MATRKDRADTEKHGHGVFAPRHVHSHATAPTQSAAIKRAKRISATASVHVERVRHTAPKETARLEARVSLDLYASLKQAAQLKGGTITDFVVNALHDATHRIIEEANIFRLSAEDQVRFAEALINPPAPNDALIRAARLHRENVEVR